MKRKLSSIVLSVLLVLETAPASSAQQSIAPGEPAPSAPVAPKVPPQIPVQPGVPTIPPPGTVRPPIIAPQAQQPVPTPAQPIPSVPQPQFSQPRVVPPPTSGGMVSLNFTRADLVEIIHIIAQHLRLTYTIDPEVKGTVTINSAEPLRSEDLLPIFHQILRMNGAVAVRNGNLYQITTIKDGKGLARPTAQGREDSFALQIVPVRFFTVAEMKRVLQPFVMQGGEIIENPRGNFLIIVDIPSNIQRLVEIADLIDVQIFAGTRMEIYQPKVASAEELAQEMAKVMQSFAASAPQPDTFTAQFIPLPRINQLLIIAHSEAAWTYARRWLERIDVVAEGPGRRIFIYPVENGKAADLADVLSQALGLPVAVSRGQTPTLQDLHRSTTGGNPQMGGTGGFGSSSTSSFGQSNTNQQRPLGSFATIPVPGQPTAPATPTAPQPLPGVPPTPSTAARPGTTTAQGAVPQEQLRIVADLGTNSLIIYGTAQEFQNIKNILRDLDAIPRQVLIEALIFQVDLTDNEDFGVNYQILAVPRTTIFGQTFGSRAALLSLGTALLPTPPGTGQTFSNFVNGLSGIVGDNTVSALIRALATDSRAKILSAPTVLASDNRPARIQVGSEEPIATGSITAAVGAVVPSSSTTIQYRNTGRIMTIIPQVNSQGLVNLQIKAEVSARGSDVNVGGQPFPSFNTQDAETSAVVHDGETLVIGGLIGENKTRARTGLPYLMDLPVVGRFFGSTSETSTKTELIILITPRVIRNQKESRIVSEEFTTKLKAVRDELDRFRGQQLRDLERERQLRNPLPPPATQVPQAGDIPIEPVPPQPVQPSPPPAAAPAAKQSAAPLTFDTHSPSIARQAAVNAPSGVTPGMSRSISAPVQGAMAPVALAQANTASVPAPVESFAPEVTNTPEMIALSSPTEPLIAGISAEPVAESTGSPPLATDPINSLLSQIESRTDQPVRIPAPATDPAKTAVWVVQVASYDREVDAQSYMSKLKKSGFDAYVAVADVSGKTRYRVEIGPLENRNDALAVQKNLRAAQHVENSIVLSKAPAEKR